MLSCNFVLRAGRPLDGLLESDVVALLSDIAYISSNPGRVFYGSRVKIPTGSGPFILIKSTGGMESSYAHSNESLHPLTCQIVVYGSGYDVSKSLADSIYITLDGRRNFSV